MATKNDYSQYTYDDVIDEITQRFQFKEGWGEGYESAVAYMLTQLFADSTDNLLYALERRSTEAFLTEAKLPSSIYTRASELGYRIRRTVSMTGSLRLQLQNDEGEVAEPQGNVEIPPNTKVSTNGVDFVTTERRVIVPGTSETTIPIKEGTVETKDFNAEVALLDSNDIVISNYETIDEYSLRVFADEEEYFDVSKGPAEYRFESLSYANSDSPVYDIKYSKQGMRVVFGDNQFGKKPRYTIKIEYVRSNKVEKPVQRTNIDFSFENQTLHDDVVQTPLNSYNYSLTNPEPIRGYLPVQDEKDVQALAPGAARENRRGVQNRDYRQLALDSGIGGIISAFAYGEQELESLIFNMNNVYIAYLTGDGQPINQQQKIDLKKYIDFYKVMQTNPVIRQADILRAVVDISIKKNPTIPISNNEAYNVVKSAVQDYFKITTESVGASYYHSDLVSYLQEYQYQVNGVKYPLTRYVSIRTRMLYELPVSNLFFDIELNMDRDDLNGVEGETVTVELDGDSYTETVRSNDSIPEFMERLRKKIVNNGSRSFITGIVSSNNNLRINSGFIDQPFTVKVSGSLADDVRINKIYDIPFAEMKRDGTVDNMVPGSARIIDRDGNIIYSDQLNADGVMVGNANNPNAAIDYKSMKLEAPTSLDPLQTYYFVYDQDPYGNMRASKSSAILLSDFSSQLLYSYTLSADIKNDNYYVNQINESEYYFSNIRFIEN